jgi:hypothetical protein
VVEGILSPPPGKEALEIRAIGHQRIQAEGEQPLQAVQVGARGAPAGGEPKVAGEVGEGQLLGGNELTRGPLPAGIWDRC